MILASTSRKSLLLRYIIPFLLLPPVFAVDMPPVTFRGISAVGEVSGIYFTNAKGKAEEFRTCDYMFSGFYRAAGGSQLVFYRLIPAEKEGEEPTREVVGTVPWPVGRGPFLVLASQSGDKYDFSVVADDVGSFPIGSFRVINASRHKVHARAGDKTAALEPGASTVLKPTPLEGKKGVLFQLAMETIPDRLLFSNVWARTQIARTLVFVLNRPHPEHPVDVKRIQEDDKLLNDQREKEEREAKEAKKQ